MTFIGENAFNHGHLVLDLRYKFITEVWRIWAFWNWSHATIQANILNS